MTVDPEDMGPSLPVGRTPAPGILFLCLARNCAATLPGFFAYLKELDRNGFRAAAIIGENGSTDGTRVLIERAADGRIALLDTSFMAQTKSRLARMAAGRQALLESALARGMEQEFVCVADLDNIMAAPPPVAAVREAAASLRASSTWFAMGATSRPFYYDLLSLRAEGFEFLHHLYAEIEAAKRRPWRYYRFHREHIYQWQKRITANERALCASSFNGFCLYRSRDYFQGTYRAPDETEVCEHVSFNLSLARATGKSMVISPRLVIQAPADHIQVGFFRFWRDRLRERMPW